MISFNTNAHDFRSQRKCFFLTGCCLVFVLLMSQASCRPSESDDNGDSLTYISDYVDADDIEWQNFPAVEATTKDHPTIFYKEDIVSEDYDPSKENKTSTEKHHGNKKKSHHRRKYKEISSHGRSNKTESFQYTEPEKVYFDIIPNENDEVRKDDDDSKFNGDDIQVEFISLLEDNNSKEETKTSDSDLSKNFKHQHQNRHRHRRDVTFPIEDVDKVSLRHKRNPYYHRSSHYSNQLPHYRGVFVHPQVVIYPTHGAKQPIKSPNYYNAYSPGGGVINKFVPPTSTPIPIGQPESITQRIGDDDNDRPVWDTGNTRRPATAPTMATKPPRRTQPPILQYGDEDYVAPAGSSNHFSGSAVSDQFTPRITSQAAARPAPTSRTTTTSAPPTSRGISSCIWAISSCCTRTEKIRYQCFERLGCTGAFWDLNPCADDIFRLAVQAADKYLD